jgi:hypothetical protein
VLLSQSTYMEKNGYTLLMDLKHLHLKLKAKFTQGIS